MESDESKPGGAAPMTADELALETVRRAGRVKPPRRYHRVLLGKTEFVVDVRYYDLKPIGRGAYGLVAAATDVVSIDCMHTDG